MCVKKEDIKSSPCFVPVNLVNTCATQSGFDTDVHILQSFISKEQMKQQIWFPGREQFPHSLKFLLATTQTQVYVHIKSTKMNGL